MDNLTSCFSVMVDLRTRKTEMMGDCANYLEKLELKRISCASQFTIPHTVGTSANPAGNYTHTR
jgi:hypothetical protein